MPVADYPEDLVPLALQLYISVMSFPRQRWSIELFSRREENSKG